MCVAVYRHTRPRYGVARCCAILCCCPSAELLKQGRTVSSHNENKSKKVLRNLKRN